MSQNYLNEVAYQKLRESIVKGVLMPGTHLSENELANEYNMSRTPIRAAISRLESEGLITSLKKRGFLVKNISYNEILNILEVQLMLRLYALNSIKQQDLPCDLHALRQFLDKQIEASKNDDYYEYISQSFMFSRFFISSVNNEAISAIYDSFRDRIIYYSVVNWKMTPHHKHYHANEINQSIYKALIEKDYDIVQQKFNESYQNARQRLILQGVWSDI
ncbi:GntR family transcriptional regulator [Metabacillus arenae]|uniref:GntR family transcriptional regulator n=1 Tax=Metabacillus arenae TaxID=2771434 RepID=A0A926RX07_9BACI|nr:GntR family transcriptional regulator [Metabacillus arenae]MBD1380491.1 GntR family transcriptional regulator [Metabacillus arenae]